MWDLCIGILAYPKIITEDITGNYQLVYQWREKCGNYRDTGVSKKAVTNVDLFKVIDNFFLLCK